MVQFAFGLLYERSAMRELLAEEDLGGVARSPLGMGILTGKLSPDSVFPADDVRSQMDFGSGRHRMLVEWTDRVLGTLTADGHTPAQGALAWILTTDPGVVPVPGARTEAQAVEKAGAAGLGRLSEEQMVRLEGFRAAGIEAVRAYYRSEPDASETDGWPLR